jgi:hypothetical protein
MMVRMYGFVIGFLPGRQSSFNSQPALAELAIGTGAPRQLRYVARDGLNIGLDVDEIREKVIRSGSWSNQAGGYVCPQTQGDCGKQNLVRHLSSSLLGSLHSALKLPFTGE